MTLIKGIPIRLQTRTSSGHDPFGAPTFEIGFKTVENVLVSPISSEDQVNLLNLTGEKIVYDLAIPKGNTDIWEDRVVEFFGERFRTVGDAVQGIETLIPLDWNKKIKVVRLEEEALND